jgi:transketolase
VTSRTDTPALTAADERFLTELARQLRADSIRCSTTAGSGHPTSAMSAADLMAVLLARHLRYDWDNPGEPGNDHLIFSKGHASPLLYAMFKAAGAITDEELVTGFRRLGSRLQGHPTPALPWVDVATGSLGQGLPGDEVTLIGAGVTVHQCLRAAGELAADGIAARVIDVYSVKPADQATMADAAAATGGRLVIVEDHYPQGSLGAAVLEALAAAGVPLLVRQRAVSGLPGSGTPDELMEAAGISASRVAAAARELLRD